jgi:hypothetical protein
LSSSGARNRHLALAAAARRNVRFLTRAHRSHHAVSRYTVRVRSSTPRQNVSAMCQIQDFRGDWIGGHENGVKRVSRPNRSRHDGRQPGEGGW